MRRVMALQTISEVVSKKKEICREPEKKFLMLR